MRFDRAALEVLDEDFTEEEKRYLLAKFFPKTAPAPWQEALRKGRNDWKRWQGFLEVEQLAPLGAPYRFSHPWLVQAARTNRPSIPGTNVTDFSGWVFSLYSPRKDPRDLARGRDVERELVRRYVSGPSKRGWDLEYEGIRSEGRQ